MSVNLTPQEIRLFNSNYTKNVGKYHQMFGGVNSSLIALHRSTLVIEITVNYKWLANKSIEQTKNQFLESYQNQLNSSLGIDVEQIKYYVVVIKRKAIYALNVKFTWKNRTHEDLVDAFNIKETDTILKVFANKA